MRSAEHLVSRWASAITCCSDAVRHSVRSRIGGDPGKYITIYNGVPVERFGTLEEPSKGLAVLIEAMALLKESSHGRSFCLWIV